jgi:hypothetical protein
MNALFRSFEENSIIWMLVSLGLGGIIGAGIKLLFEHVFTPRVQSARAARQALREYSYPLLRAADALDARLANLIRFADSGWFDDPEDDHYRLGTLYLLGSYFGWCKILEDAAFLEFQESDRKARRFNIHFYRVFKALTGFYYVQDMEEAREPQKETGNVPRLALTAIGEVMIAGNQGQPDGSALRVLSFLEFIKSYEESEEFRKWFGYLTRFLGNLTMSEDDPRWNRVVSLATNLRLFVAFLDPRSRGTSRRRIHYLKYLHPTVAARLGKEIEQSGHRHMLAPDGRAKREPAARLPAAVGPASAGDSPPSTRSPKGIERVADELPITDPGSLPGTPPRPCL